ncbi:gamma-mobile-trio protein GmtX [Marinobacter goseongensis]|uniref:gamma-mobile-trio protein GmtX n=1 Tax=Marinobacter goseongensis TaxID=453838 RepID=UPI002005C43F|nr:gamma-mobile-trio protein GmtX [Marinobacter goseongensis]MCK7553247.1 gamma-mobile-trio protein GmtX [Marinobacter goseongensis]
MKPEELLEKLKEKATPRASRTLEAIYEICKEQEQRGLDDFAIATIARLGHKRGVPKAQSIRNKTGEPYRALLQSFAEHHKSDKPPMNPKGEDDWIEEIGNAKHKLLARIQAAELAAANKKLREFVPPGTRIEVRDYQNEAAAEDRPLSPLERRALEYLISDEFLGKWGFSLSEYGEIIDSSGNVVLRPATVDAVKKALTYL